MTRIELRKENIKILQQNLIRSLECLKEAEKKHDEILISMYQDSVIKRFEPFYAITWKFLKDFLELHNIDMIPSPKKIFKTCQERGIISEREMHLLLEAIEFQIKMADHYDDALTESFAQKIAQTYYPTMQAIIDRLSPQ